MRTHHGQRRVIERKAKEITNRSKKQFLILIASNILIIRKQDLVSLIDGIVPDIGFSNTVQNTGKDMLVQDDVSFSHSGLSLMRLPYLIIKNLF
jgi:hypothetical protein